MEKSMKRLIIMTAITLLMTSCMQARNKSAVYGTGSDGANYAGQYPGNSNNGSSDDGYNFEPIDKDTDSSTDTSTGTTIPSEVSHCTWATTSSGTFTRDTNHLGKINICQSKTNELNVYIQVKTPITSTKLCAIPMYEYSGKAIYIGNPRCSFLPDSGIYKIPLLKNRDGNYSQYNVTAVMLIKDMKFNYPAPFATQYNLYGTFNAVDAFLYCSQYLDRTGVATFCNAFNSINQHVYQSFNE